MFRILFSFKRIRSQFKKKRACGSQTLENTLEIYGLQVRQAEDLTNIMNQTVTALEDRHSKDSLVTIFEILFEKGNYASPSKPPVIITKFNNQVT